MNCIIIDDNELERKAIKHLLMQLENISLIGEFDNPINAINFIKTNNVDLLLLDVEMPEMTGIEFLQSMSVRPLVILITSNPGYAVEAFEHNVVDFILKPVQVARLVQAISRAQEIYNSRDSEVTIAKDFFFVKDKGVSRKVVLNDVLFVQALGDYVSIHLSNKTKYTIYSTLNNFAKHLPSADFFRVHRSYIVALNKIETVEDGTIFIMHNAIPVAKTYREELSNKLNII